jgi:AsmA protein
MKRFIKYGVLPVVVFLFLLVVTIIALPVVINVQKFLPEIEERLSHATGRTISIGSDFAVTFFPYLSVSFSDMKIDNPEGFLSDSLMKIGSFEARVKLLPLLKKEVEISRFIIGGLEVHLEKKSDGRVNWELPKKENAGQTSATSGSDWAHWSVPENLSIVLFAITDGTVMWNDREHNSDYRIDDLMLLVNNFTSSHPFAVEVKASLGDKSLIAEGELGPLGQDPGRAALPFDLALNLMNSFSGQVEGKLVGLFENPSYDFKLHISPFSARELFNSLNVGFPYITSDPTTYRSVGLDFRAKGDKEKISIEDGKIIVDDTLLGISLAVNKFKDPDLDFSLDIDYLDLDRYLPPEDENKKTQIDVTQSEQGSQVNSSFGKMNLAGALHINELRVYGGIVNDINGQIHYADDVFTVDSSSFALYQGRAQSSLTVDLKNEPPITTINLKAQSVQSRPILHDFMAKDFLSGSVDTDVHLQFSGYSSDAVRKSLGGEGFLSFKDGTLEGIDMVNAIKNIVDLSSSSDISDQPIRTDFSEFKSVFTVSNGLVTSRETTLTSPVARVVISGTADLVTTELKLKVQPQVVASNMEEQGDDKVSLKGLIPFALSGTFAQPQIDIDGQYIPLDNITFSEEGDVQRLVDQKLPSPVDEDVKDAVGTTLVDPVVVAQHFGLQPELIQKKQAKKQLTIGKGKIHVSPLKEEDAWH